MRWRQQHGSGVKQRELKLTRLVAPVAVKNEIQTLGADKIITAVKAARNLNVKMMQISREAAQEEQQDVKVSREWANAGPYGKLLIGKCGGVLVNTENTHTKIVFSNIN